MLTSLHFTMESRLVPLTAAAAAAFTTLNASTNLCSLQAAPGTAATCQDVVLFKKRIMYPDLHLIDLYLAVQLSEQQLQQLCSCCPAVETLTLVVCRNPSLRLWATAWQPLTHSCWRSHT
jgi:hypothetical protein